MKNGFEKIEYGLKLLKEDSEKINKDFDIVEKFSKYIGKEKSSSFKIKYALTYVFILLLTLNLFLTFEKLNLEKAKKSYIIDLSEKKDALPEMVDVTLNENKGYMKRENKIVRIKNMKDEKISPIEESIKFTEEINKIIGLFFVNLNIGGEDVEI